MKQNVLQKLKCLKNLSFYKKKGFYMVLSILFSLLLLADVAVAVFVPEQTVGFGGRGGFSGDMSSFEDGEMTMPEMPSSEDGEMTMPEMPSSEDGEMTMPEMPSSEDGEMMMPGSMETETSFLQKVKAHWIVIFIFFLILDALSIFMWVRIARKQKKEEEVLALEDQQEGAVSVRKKTSKPVKNRNHTPILAGIGVAAVVLLVCMVKLFSGQNQEIDQTEATVYTETAEKGDVSTILPGTGTLTDEESIDLELPEDVEITEWYVSNGDIVAEGDKLAQVDSVSVMSAIVTIQDKLVVLDEELEEHEDETISDTIKAGAAGRVKKIYAEEGESVVDTMYDHGALMLISLDGMMAVSFETKADISAGTSVTVITEDGTGLTGKVQSMTDGTAVVTVSDEDVDFGETLAVEIEGGAEIGSGEAYIHSELKITGLTGITEDVEVSVNEEVSSGEALLTLTDVDYEGEYELLLAQRNKLETQMQELFQLYQENYVYASCAGMISGLENVASTKEDEAEDTTEESTSSDSASSDSASTDSAAVSPMNYTSGNGGISNMSYRTVGSIKAISCTTSSEDGLVTAAEDGEDNIAGNDDNSGNNNDNGGDNNNSGNNDNAGGDDNTDNNNNSGNGDNAGNNDSNNNTENGSNSGNDAGNNSGTKEPSLETQVTYTNCVCTVMGVTDNGDGTLLVQVKVLSSGMQMQVTLSKSLYVYTFNSGSYTAGTAADITANDTLMLIYPAGQSSSIPEICIRIVGNVSAGMNDQQSTEEASPDSASGSMSMSGTGSVSGLSGDVLEVVEEQVEVNYGITTTQWLSITPQETMDITITVDEMDILSLEKGQEAQVTLDALPGQAFEGTVTSIDLSGVNSGGSSKYTAVVQIAREENMLSGMNASVSIILDTKEDVLVIPEAALVEENQSVYVYTSYNEETDTLGDLVEVTTGVSDGENVEILSGLEEGDTFCYSYLDVVNYTTSFSGGSGFSMNSLFGGGRGR